jgi:hypothetical protein
MLSSETWLRPATTCSLWFLARGFFCPEGGGDTFLRCVGSHKIYTRHIPEDGILRSHRRGNLSLTKLAIIFTINNLTPEVRLNSAVCPLKMFPHGASALFA